MHKLPVKLEREPLVEALFEVRLSSMDTLADILPGFLFHELDPKPTVVRLPAAEIPQPMRANDPNLQFMPVLRLEWLNYFIAVGDQSFTVSCKLPYPKWQNFKSTILDVVRRITKVGFNGKVERYSVKYINLIQASSLAEQISKIRMSINIGSIELRDDHATLQVHRKEDNVTHILSIIIGAKGKLPDGKEVSGAVVDIDSIRDINPSGFEDFASSLEPGLEQLRQANKIKFFGCLTENTIEEMGPIYD